MSIETIAFLFGVLLLSVGILGGGFELKELKVPRVGGLPRASAAVLGLVFVGLGIGIKNDVPLLAALRPSAAAETAPAAPAPTVLAAGPALQPGPAAETPRFDLSGEWKVVNVTESTSYNPYRGLRLGYRLFVQQEGRRFTAEGEKYWENDEEVPHRRRTPIYLEGSVQGDTIRASFREKGTRRTTSGRFVWKVINGGRITGSFTSTAADSSGISSGTRLADSNG